MTFRQPFVSLSTLDANYRRIDGANVPFGVTEIQFDGTAARDVQTAAGSSVFTVDTSNRKGISTASDGDRSGV